jgi:hypothetical protein
MLSKPIKGFLRNSRDVTAVADARDADEGDKEGGAGAGAVTARVPEIENHSSMMKIGQPNINQHRLPSPRLAS